MMVLKPPFCVPSETQQTEPHSSAPPHYSAGRGFYCWITVIWCHLTGFEQVTLPRSERECWCESCIFLTGHAGVQVAAS